MRKYIRDVKVRDIVSHLAVPIPLVAALWILRPYIISWIPHDVRIIYVVMGLITYILARRILVGIVFLYKIFAPEWLRGQCRFEPTCSTYMILAIRKYGILIGVSKGLHRIIRCRPPNGGVDYP